MGQLLKRALSMDDSDAKVSFTDGSAASAGGPWVRVARHLQGYHMCRR